MNDYICTNARTNTTQNSVSCLVNCEHTITNSYLVPKHICFTSLLPEHQRMLALLSTTNEPQTFKEAVINPAWQAAMMKEFEALDANNTWELVPLPKGKKTI